MSKKQMGFAMIFLSGTTGTKNTGALWVFTAYLNMQVKFWMEMVGGWTLKWAPN